MYKNEYKIIIYRLYKKQLKYMKSLILNEKKNKVEINIIGNIGNSLFSKGYTREDAKRDILENKDKELIVNIFSDGGNFYDGVFIHDLLKQHPMPTTSNILGMAASTASVIALGADNVRMSKNASLMIHQPAIVGGSINPSNVDEIKDTLENGYTILLNIYQTKTGLNDDVLKEMMDGKDFWMTSSKAKKLGFIDEEFEPRKELVNLYNAVEDGKIIENHLKNKISNDMELENKYTELENSHNELVNNYDLMKNELDSVRLEKESLEQEKVELENNYNSLEEEKTILVNEKVELETKIKELNEKEIVTFLSNSVESGKITEPEREKFIVLANNDFESVKELINLRQPRLKSSELIINKETSNLEELIKGKENWDEIDFEAKDKNTLKQIKNNYPEYYSVINKRAYPNL